MTPPERHLFLIGFRGCGKSTVARLLAERTGVRAIDTDRRIVENAGMSIREIFERQGESSFRDLETAAIAELTDELPAIVALGGGAILREENREMLRRLGVVVRLVASPETLAERIARDAASTSDRPPLTSLPPVEEVRRLVAEREPLYRESADVTIDAEAGTPDRIVATILAEPLVRRLFGHRP